MILPIFLYGSDVLRRPTKEITEMTDELKTLISDMFETMYNADGIGLAAPQIGKSLRLLVIDADPLSADYPELKGFKRVVINPEILSTEEDSCVVAEGCLSIPGISENVPRSTGVRIRYRDENFQEQEEELNGFCARVFLHEYDHITETLFIDRIAPLRKRLIKNKLQKMARNGASPDYPVKK